MTSYHVVYHYLQEDEDGLKAGLGSITYVGNLTTAKQVDAISAAIKSQIGASRVVLTNWFELADEPDPAAEVDTAPAESEEVSVAA